MSCICVSSRLAYRLACAISTVATTVLLAGCAANTTRNGLTTTRSEPIGARLAPMLPPKPPAPAAAPVEPQAPTQPAYVYRGGPQGTYAPSPYWGAAGPATGAPAGVPAPRLATRPGATPPATPVATPAAPPVAAAPRIVNGRRVVDVLPGDTLYGIARRHNVSLSGLMSENRLSSIRVVPGQQLVLPRG